MPITDGRHLSNIDARILAMIFASVLSSEMGLYDSHLVGDLSGFKINVIKAVLSVAILDVNASDKFRSSYLLSYKLMKLGRDLR